MRSRGLLQRTLRLLRTMPERLQLPVRLVARKEGQTMTKLEKAFAFFAKEIQKIDGIIDECDPVLKNTLRAKREHLTVAVQAIQDLQWADKLLHSELPCASCRHRDSNQEQNPCKACLYETNEGNRWYPRWVRGGLRG